MVKLKHLNKCETKFKNISDAIKIKHLSSSFDLLSIDDGDHEVPFEKQEIKYNSSEIGCDHEIGTNEIAWKNLHKSYVIRDKVNNETLAKDVSKNLIQAYVFSKQKSSENVSNQNISEKEEILLNSLPDEIIKEINSRINVKTGPDVCNDDNILVVVLKSSKCCKCDGQKNNLDQTLSIARDFRPVASQSSKLQGNTIGPKEKVASRTNIIETNENNQNEIKKKKSFEPDEMCTNECSGFKNTDDTENTSSCSKIESKYDALTCTIPKVEENVSGGKKETKNEESSTVLPQNYKLFGAINKSDILKKWNRFISNKCDNETCPHMECLKKAASNINEGPTKNSKQTDVFPHNTNVDETSLIENITPEDKTIKNNGVSINGKNTEMHQGSSINKIENKSSKENANNEDEKLKKTSKRNISEEDKTVEKSGAPIKSGSSYIINKHNNIKNASTQAKNPKDSTSNFEITPENKSEKSLDKKQSKIHQDSSTNDIELQAQTLNKKPTDTVATQTIFGEKTADLQDNMTQTDYKIQFKSHVQNCTNRSTSTCVEIKTANVQTEVFEGANQSKENLQSSGENINSESVPSMIQNLPKKLKHSTFSRGACMYNINTLTFPMDNLESGKNRNNEDISKLIKELVIKENESNRALLEKFRINTLKQKESIEKLKKLIKTSKPINEKKDIKKNSH